MKNLFIPYELAVKLKENGFDEECFGYYNTKMRLSSPGVLGLQIGLQNYNYPLFVSTWYSSPEDIISAPLYQQAVEWLRKKYDIEVWVESGYDIGHKTYGPFLYQRSTMTDYEYAFEPDRDSEDYYVALAGGIEEALKLI